mmetsp:Transcript_50741/g.120850  ORF Transcript_50741/g.120850 Transcript_50741/m.120850 type:complete len:295 (-) Transcript_50741:24-908(-)
MELHELEVLERQARARDHGVAVARARVRGRGGEPRAAVPARGEHRVLCAEAVEGAVLHAQGQHPHALALVVHDEIKGEVLDEEHGVESQGLAVEGVEHRVPRAVRHRGAPVRLAALAELEGLSAERALVDLALVGAREGHAVRLQLDHRARRLLAHVLDRLLVAEPVRALDGVVEVPPPVVLGHVAERGVDAALRRHRVRARGEQLRDARHGEPVLREADRRAEPSSTGTHHNGVVGVVDDCIVAHARRVFAAEVLVAGDGTHRRSRVEGVLALGRSREPRPRKARASPPQHSL